MRMREIVHTKMPREKFIKYGPTKLEDAELLGIILGSGTKGVNVVEVARKALEAVKKIGVNEITDNDLMKIKGLGQIRALQVRALLALSLRLYDREFPRQMNSRDIWLKSEYICSSVKERALAYYFDARERYIAMEEIAWGSVSACNIEARDVFEPAIRNSASSVILVHNHPSGVLSPSTGDILVTRKLKELGEAMCIKLSDHIIITKEGYVSVE